MNKIVALMPMKIYSERVNKKNIRPLANKPLFFHIADTLKKTEIFSKLIINTDSSEIAIMATNRYKNWVIIHDRPDDLCGDLVSMNRIIEYDLSVVEGVHFLQTHSTNPLLKAKTIDNAVNQYFFTIEKYDSLFSVTKLQTRLYDKSIHPVNHNPTELIRTQDLVPLYEENSNFYIFSKSSFNNAKKDRIGIKPNIFEINKLEAIDIDNKEDFIIAEAIKGKLDYETKR